MRDIPPQHKDPFLYNKILGLLDMDLINTYYEIAEEDLLFYTSDPYIDIDLYPRYKSWWKYHYVEAMLKQHIGRCSSRLGWLTEGINKSIISRGQRHENQQRGKARTAKSYLENYTEIADAMRINQ